MGLRDQRSKTEKGFWRPSQRICEARNRQPRTEAGGGEPGARGGGMSRRESETTRKRGGALRVPRARSLTPSPWGALSQQGCPVRKRTQVLNEFIHEKTRGPSYWLQAPEALVGIAVRAGAPPGRGLVGGAGSSPGTEEQTQAAVGTEGRSSLPACPALPRGPAPPLGLKCSWEEWGEGTRQLESPSEHSHPTSPRPSSSSFLEAHPESIPPRSLLGTSG